MSSISQTRVSARALIGAVLLGTTLGAVLGGAYLAGGMAQAASQHARVARIADAAAMGFSEDALQLAVRDMGPGAQAVARRHDPFTSAGAAQRDRQTALLAARLERHARKAGTDASTMLLRASFGGAFNPAAAPFRIGGALEASRDLECLTQAIYYEARGEGPSGQAAVAQVVLNRVRHPAFPKSVCAVVFQGAYGRGACQFSFACDGSMRKRRESAAWRRAESTASRALSGSVMAAVGNATHFHTINVAPAWGPRLLRVGQVGLHIFYRFGGRAGRPGAFDRTPDLSLDGPEMTVEPVYAGLTSIASPPGIGEPASAVFAASAVTEPKLEMVPAVPGAMGGPSGAASEPASAQPAAPTAEKVSSETAVRPARTPSVTAS